VRRLACFPLGSGILVTEQYCTYARSGSFNNSALEHLPRRPAGDRAGEPVTPGLMLRR